MRTTGKIANQNENIGVKAAFPIMAAVFISFMVIGMALPVLPLQVHNVLGFGTFVVGSVAGCQFVASLISRLWAGRLTDTRGAKYAVKLGFSTSIAGGLFYTISLFFVKTPILSVLSLIIGRTLLGGAESLVITGGILWALQLVEGGRSAKVIAWVGMSMFAALASGAPVGSFVFEIWKFDGIAIATILMSLASLLMIQRVRSPTPHVHSEQTNIPTVFKTVLLPGVGFALSGLTFGTITTFLTLFFFINHWDNGALAFALFAIMLILTRISCGHLPDRFGGARVVIYCLIIQSVGLVLIGTAHSSGFAMLGAAVSGAGFSLVFPGLGIEAIKRAPRESRGLAMGVYNAFLDMTLGFGSPALGFLAGRYGLNSVFLASAIAAVLALPITIRLLIFREADPSVHLKKVEY
jgi:MFS family permease